MKRATRLKTFLVAFPVTQNEIVVVKAQSKAKALQKFKRENGSKVWAISQLD